MRCCLVHVTHVDNVVCVSEKCVLSQSYQFSNVVLYVLFLSPNYHSTLDGDTDKFVESMKSLFDYQESQIRISVEGFNTSADPVELYTSLQDLFKTCGEVDHIEFKIDRVRKQVIRFVSFFFFLGYF